MRILLSSYAFAPSIGGIETVSLILARSLAQRGYEVVVVTDTPGLGREPDEAYRVVRKPNARALIAEIRKADLVLQSNISLRLAWPLWLLFPRKPFVLVLHGPLTRPNGQVAWQDRLKRVLLRRAYYQSVSRYLAETVRAGSRVIRNPYDNATFRRITGVDRDGDLLFVGRFVTAKGVDTLLRAFVTVLRSRPNTSLSIIGSGSEENTLRELAKSLGIEQSVCFLGAKQGSDLAEAMNRHKILVVPSRSVPPEACPVVPVEGIACGCVPVASRMGGLPESVGDAGVLFEEENVEELADILLRLLNSPQVLDQYRAKAGQHLSQFDPDKVVDTYESHFAACRHEG